jgi:tRNA threonylcarbamoyladenosine biosynthesis protein TsaE
MSKHEQFESTRSYESDSAERTALAARDIIASLAQQAGATVIALSGDLGAGKTQFAKGVASALGIERTVTSPTFLIMRSYETRRGAWKRLFHLDCYRVDDPAELRALGWDEIITNPDNIVVVEWAERISAILPQGTVWVDMNIVSPSKRNITVRA